MTEAILGEWLPMGLEWPPSRLDILLYLCFNIPNAEKRSQSSSQERARLGNTRVVIFAIGDWA